jgi:hypothetical protein
MADDELVPVIFEEDEDFGWDVWPVNDRHLQDIMDQRGRHARFYPGAGPLPTGMQVFMIPLALLDRYERSNAEAAEVQDLITGQRGTAPTMRLAELAKKRGFKSNA